ncbi:MAG: type IV pilus modification protein PilV [Pseudomonadota bacterium]|nr:MAG: type IV pilus modification protein PilV [Pseudomonadota bacterium]
MQFNSSQNFSSRVGGFTLMEVAVAMVIFSVGLLGLAGLQLTGVQNINDALLRTTAVQQAADMAERIRANPAGAINGNYDTISAGVSGAACSNRCDPSQTALNDRLEWSTAIDTTLPAGQGTVQGALAGLSREFTITVQWDGNRRGAQGTNCPPQGPDDMDCIQLTVRPTP